MGLAPMTGDGMSAGHEAQKWATDTTHRRNALRHHTPRPSEEPYRANLHKIRTPGGVYIVVAVRRPNPLPRGGQLQRRPGVVQERARFQDAAPHQRRLKQNGLPKHRRQQGAIHCARRPQSRPSPQLFPGLIDGQIGLLDGAVLSLAAASGSVRFS
jgi:hypothetical protein